jgi:hypothetical protein
LTGGRRGIGDAAQPAFRFAEVKAEVAAAAAAVAVGLAVNLDEDFLVWSEKNGITARCYKTFLWELMVPRCLVEIRLAD